MAVIPLRVSVSSDVNRIFMYPVFDVYRVGVYVVAKDGIPLTLAI